MAANLAAMIAGVGGMPAGALTAAQRTTLTTLSGALLSSLYSCADNLRAGDSGLNASIGYSIDANFQPGVVWYDGPIRRRTRVVRQRPAADLDADRRPAD